jgi:uncharacterized protein
MKTKKDVAFFSILEMQAKAAYDAAGVFHDLVTDFEQIGVHTKKVDVIEHEADQLTHLLVNKMDATFITPLDKEDLRDLSQALDDITDCIEAAAARAELYRLTEPREDLEPLVRLLVRAAEATWEAVSGLKNGFQKSDALRQTLINIHLIENESDRAFRQALADLFHEPGADTLTVIKWKEIYDRIEASVDKCEDVAKILGSVIIKYA